MNIYTLEDLSELGKIYDERLSSNLKIPNDIPDERLPEYYFSSYSYSGLMNMVIKEKETPEKSLMEFIGSYEMVVHDSTSWSMLHRFLFELPLIEMPLFINESAPQQWKNNVATWRLRMGK